MMPRIATHQDETIRFARNASQSGDVPDCMAWGVEKVQRAVAEVVQGFHISDLEISGNFELDQLTASQIAFEHGTFGVCRIARQETCAETRTDDEGSTGWPFRR